MVSTAGMISTLTLRYTTARIKKKHAHHGKHPIAYSGASAMSEGCQDIPYPVVRLQKALFAGKLDILAQSHDKADTAAVPFPPELSIRAHPQPVFRPFGSE